MCDQVLKELDSTWSVMEFEHDEHLRTKTPLLRSSEELIETLEDNQVSKYYYKEDSYLQTCEVKSNVGEHE